MHVYVMHGITSLPITSHKSLKGNYLEVSNKLLSFLLIRKLGYKLKINPSSAERSRCIIKNDLGEKHDVSAFSLNSSV